MPNPSRTLPEDPPLEGRFAHVPPELVDFLRSKETPNTQLEAVHQYTHEDGTPWWWRVQFHSQSTNQNHQLMIHQNEQDQFVKGCPDFENRAPLYGLHRLREYPKKVVFLVDGEGSANLLNGIGLVAVTWPSGEFDLVEVDLSPLKGRLVILWPTNTDSSRQTMFAVRPNLRAEEARILSIQTLSFPEEGMDCERWIMAGCEANGMNLSDLDDPEVAQSLRDAILNLPVLNNQDPKLRLCDAMSILRQQGRQVPTVDVPQDEEQPAEIVSLTKDEALIEYNRLARLSSLEYERCRKVTAKNLGMRVEMLDREVRAIQQKHQQEERKTLRFPEVPLWPDPVNGPDLLNLMHATIRRFIVCDVATSIAATIWCAFTWFIEVVEVAPVGVITAPMPECGKSQMLDVMGRMSRRPMVFSNTTGAAAMRITQQYTPTLILDEVDTFLAGDELMRGLIDSGHTRRNAHHSRAKGSGEETVNYCTWGAKLLCGIGEHHATIMGRAIVFELRRRLPTENVELLRRADPQIFKDLSSQLARWSSDGLEIIRNAQPDTKGLENRGFDNWDPLFAIADYAGGKWPEHARKASVLLTKKRRRQVENPCMELLQDIQSAFHELRTDRLFSSQLISLLTQDDHKRWATYKQGRALTPRELSILLRPYGIAPHTIRSGEQNFKGYLLEQFRDTFARYLGSG